MQRSRRLVTTDVSLRSPPGHRALSNGQTMKGPIHARTGPYDLNITALHGIDLTERLPGANAILNHILVVSKCYKTEWEHLKYMHVCFDGCNKQTIS